MLAQIIQPLTYVKNLVVWQQTLALMDSLKASDEEIQQYHCINNQKPEKLDFNDGASESNLDPPSKYLLKEDQDGFVKFFKDNNQGAGEQKITAINLANLYVINLLAGLSFLIRSSHVNTRRLLFSYGLWAPI